MSLIARIYEPDVAVLPIGDHFTMGPREAAVALELLGVDALRPVPLRHVPAPDRDAGRSCASSRPGRRDPRARAGRDGRRCDAERWFGATGRRVPEIALEGTVDVEGALVLDDVARRRAASTRRTTQGTPVVVRAATPRRSRQRSRPARGRLRARPDRGAARARPPGAHVRLARGRLDVLDRRLRPRRAASGASPRSRSSSRSARSCRGPSRTSARSRRSRTRTRATGRTGSRCCAQGLSAEEVVERLTDGRRRPRAAAARRRRRGGPRRDVHRRRRATTWAGGRTGAGYAAQGNILVSGRHGRRARGDVRGDRRAAARASGCSTASTRRRRPAATAAASSRPRCSSSSATAATPASRTSSSTCASTTTRAPLDELRRLLRPPRPALRQDAARAVDRRSTTSCGAELAGAPRRLGYERLEDWAGAENLEERVDGDDAIDPVVLDELRRRR